MKKSLLVFSIFILILTSCSSDSIKSNTVLLVKEINSKTVNYDGTHSEMNYKYVYNGNKIFSVSYRHSLAPLLTIMKYFYTNDLITNIKVGDISITYLEYQYQYDIDNRLIKETTISYINLPEDLKVYTYNQDNTVIRQSYHGTIVDTANLYETVKIYLDTSNRFIKLEIFDGTIWNLKNQVTYINYNSPFKYVVGYDKLHLLGDTKNAFGTYKNYTNTSTYQYLVNAVNFPIRRIETYKSANGDTFWTTTSDYQYY